MDDPQGDFHAVTVPHQQRPLKRQHGEHGGKALGAPPQQGPLPRGLCLGIHII